MTLDCIKCGNPHGGNGRRKMCIKCSAVSQCGHRSVRHITRRAVRHGLIPDFRGEKCADCGTAAECHDHRDYNDPFLVEPVCKMCNWKRGPGAELSVDIEILRERLHRCLIDRAA